MGATFTIAIIYIISIVISLIYILVDVGDTAVDAATAGTVGVGTNTVDLVVEFILESIQIGLLLFVISLAPGESISNNKFYIGLFVFLSFLDIVCTIGGFALYFDFVETPFEFISETVQNSLIAQFLF